MKLSKITVRKLFGTFDYDIPLNLDERITIIHGLNGYGKTAILQIANEVLRGGMSVLRSTPFQEFRIDFDDNTSINISKSRGQTTNDKATKPQHIIFHFGVNGRETEEWKMTTNRAKESPHLSFSLLEQYIPSIERIRSDEWIYQPTGEILTIDDIVARFGDLLPGEFAPQKIPSWLQNIRDAVKIKLIETQRLLNFSASKSRRRTYSDSSQPYEPTVVSYARELSQIIRNKLTEYAGLSQSLERTFPARLIKNEARLTYTEEELRVLLGDLETKRLRLISTGLLDESRDEALIGYQSIDEKTRSVLAVYIEDAHKKLDVFEDTYKKISTLKDIIDKRFTYKKIFFDKERGFAFKADENVVLSPTNLSSGEQHELVLFYELLFQMPPGSLILIDEPEISLHVGWQLEFLPDLQQVVKLSDLDILIATHSPQIINDRWDLTVELKGMPRERTLNRS